VRQSYFLFTQYIERRFQFAARVGIACDGDTAPVEIARFIELPQLFEGLAAVEICGGVVRVSLRDLFKRSDGAIEITGLDVLHGESVAGKGTRRILIKELLQDFDSGGFQTDRIPFMACPFFIPLRPVEWTGGRAPLGAIFEGECERHGTGEARFCNFGYARGLCAEFPDDTAADAVRFSVTGSVEGVVKLVWILEKDHAPVEHGFLEYTQSTGAFVAEPAGVMGVQARVFVENYLRR
jgi:hypothetical protein